MVTTAAELDGLRFVLSLEGQVEGKLSVGAGVPGTLRLEGDRLYLEPDSGGPRFEIRPEWIPSIYVSWHPLVAPAARLLAETLNEDPDGRFAILGLTTGPVDEDADLEALLPTATWECPLEGLDD